MRRSTCTLLLFAFCVVAASAREWTSADGSKTFKAELISYDPPTVTVARLKKDGELGEPFTFKDSKLSEADKRYCTVAQRALSRSEVIKFTVDELNEDGFSASTGGGGGLGFDGYMAWHRGKRGGQSTQGRAGKRFFGYTGGDWKGKTEGQADAVAIKAWQENAELRGEWEPKPKTLIQVWGEFGNTIAVGDRFHQRLYWTGTRKARFGGSSTAMR